MTAIAWITFSFTLYLLAMMGVGVYFLFRSHSLSDYYPGGGQLNRWVTASALSRDNCHAFFCRKAGGKVTAQLDRMLHHHEHHGHRNWAKETDSK